MLQTLLISLVVLRPTESACLSGLTSLLGIPQISPINSTYQGICSSIFNQTQACVNPPILAALVSSLLLVDRNFQNTTLTNRSNRLLAHLEIAHEACQAIAGQAVGTQYKNITVSEEVKTRCEQFEASYDRIQTWTTRFSDRDLKTKCFDSMSTVTYNTFCYLTSSVASFFASFDSSGLKVQVRNEDADAVVSACALLLAPICYYNNMGNILRNLKDVSIANNQVSTVCQKVSEIELCAQGSSQCTSAFKKELFEGFFTPSSSKLADATPEVSTERALQSVGSLRYVVAETGFPVSPPTVPLDSTTSVAKLALASVGLLLMVC